MVACIYAGVSVDEATGELSAPFFTEGFVPELEPAGDHLHFYLDTAVAGDERRAGTEVAGGSWKPWDAPMPFTSFGGENGRSGFTLADVEAAGARHLCVLVADADQRAIPGSGNCAPVAQLFDPTVLRTQLDRLTGTYAGRCGLGATLVLPEGWRWVDLQRTPVEEAARSLRPAAAEEMAATLTGLVALGGVIWADGPVAGDQIVSLTVIRFESDTTLTSTPDEVAAALAARGVPAGGTGRVVGARTVLTEMTDDATGRSIAYAIPDHGYTIYLVVNTPVDDTWIATGDAIAATVLGC
ncbi:MAG: hypothetical protein R2713_17390 [Ilumatobacteraceae bacterium]